MKALVAFNRDRDSYQVPWALHEVGSLGSLVTDYYHEAATYRLHRLRHRSSDNIEPELVTASHLALSLQIAAKLANRPFPHGPVARAIGRTAARQARQHPELTDLVLYSTFAREAFESSRDGQRKILFVFHPHPAEVAKQLTSAMSKGLAEGPALFAEPEMIDLRGEADRINAELRMADLVITASTYTLRSIQPFYNGPSVVVPYGHDAATAAISVMRKNVSAGRRFLFVGAGQQRKGLNTLLLAWRRFVGNDKYSTLTAVVGDPTDGTLTNLPRSVRILSRLTRAQLNELYAGSDVFVLPSWCEGFGLAYSEALSRGCHILATRNSGVPDMDLPLDDVTYFEQLDVDGVVAALNTASEMRFDRDLRAERIARAERRPWDRFRREFRSAIDPEAGKLLK